MIYEEFDGDLTQVVGDYQFNRKNSMTKKWYQSKTIKLAIVQAVAGVLVALFSEYPELSLAGWGIVVKSALDFYLRNKTVATIV